jgi:VanZ family protein
MSSPQHKDPDTGVRLGLALLAYMLAVIVVVTLVPFRFHWPARLHVQLAGGWFDFIANVVLFVPLGFLYRLVVPGARLGGPACVLAVGAALSLTIETLQLFEPTREATVFDVVANTCGMGLGGAAFARVARMPRVGGRLIDWLALELPLMALTYLLVPLLWVNTLAARGEPLRIAGALAVGTFGATIVGGIQRSYLGPSGAARPGHAAAFIAVWFLAGAFALVRSQPFVLAAGAPILGALCWWLGARAPRDGSSNRRFELSLLRSALPLYACYLALIVAAPLVADRGAWQFRLGFPEMASDRFEILRLLELAAAFTLVGYIAAEIRGRTVMRYGDALRRLAAWGAGLALAVEVIRGYDPGFGASLARGTLLALAAVYGGWLYHLQRAHVVQHLARNPAQPRSFPTMR